MRLNKNERKLLRWIDENPQPSWHILYDLDSGKNGFERILNLTPEEWDSAVSHLDSLGLLEGLDSQGPAPRWFVADIKSSGRESVREHRAYVKDMLLLWLSRLIWSVVVPILVAGATAYYVAWLKLGK